jgi:hypothetical protein
MVLRKILLAVFSLLTILILLLHRGIMIVKSTSEAFVHRPLEHEPKGAIRVAPNRLTSSWFKCDKTYSSSVYCDSGARKFPFRVTISSKNFGAGYGGGGGGILVLAIGGGEIDWRSRKVFNIY